MACSLLYQLAAVGEYEGLGGVASSGYAIDQVGEDDSLARASGQRHAEALMACFQVGEDRLDAFFLILAQVDLGRRNDRLGMGNGRLGRLNDGLGLGLGRRWG